jgi:mannose-6-phosphate isomerase-like protein (cupin superfamily)
MTMKLLRLDHQTHSEERHEQAEGLVVARGEITVSVDGQSFAVKTGGMFVVPAGALHSVESGNGGTVVIFD